MTWRGKGDPPAFVSDPGAENRFRKISLWEEKGRHFTVGRVSYLGGAKARNSKVSARSLERGSQWKIAPGAKGSSTPEGGFETFQDQAIRDRTVPGDETVPNMIG